MSEFMRVLLKEMNKRDIKGTKKSNLKFGLLIFFLFRQMNALCSIFTVRLGENQRNRQFHCKSQTGLIEVVDPRNAGFDIKRQKSDSRIHLMLYKYNPLHLAMYRAVLASRPTYSDLCS